jgi:dTDP-4-amino-4,6-dideoxygalactose transaminase
MVVSNDTELIDRIHFSLTKFGRGLRDNYCGHIHYSVGSNLCYTELQAAVALAQLERLEEQTEIRRRNARLLYDLLEDTPGLVPLKPQSYCDVHGLHAFVMLFDSKQFEGAGRAQFLAAMHAEGAPAMSWYPMPLYQQPMYRNEPSLRERHFDCPVVETAARQACFFENNILLAEREQIERLAEIVKKVRTHASQLRNIQIDEKKHMGSAVLAGARERAAAP